MNENTSDMGHAQYNSRDERILTFEQDWDQYMHKIVAQFSEYCNQQNGDSKQTSWNFIFSKCITSSFFSFFLFSCIISLKQEPAT